MKIKLVGPSHTSYSLAASAQDSINCYLESMETAEGKNQFVLRGRPGIRLLADLTVTVDPTATPIRGLWSGGGRLFVAAGPLFFEIDSDGNLVGATSFIADDHSPVDILPNGNQLFIVSAGKSYWNNGTSGNLLVSLPVMLGKCNRTDRSVSWVDSAHSLAVGRKDTFDIGMVGQPITINGIVYTVESMTNPKLLLLTAGAGTDTGQDWWCGPVMNAVRGAFLDGYFIVNRPQSRQINISGLLDGSSWSQLDYAIKEGYPDNIAAIHAEPPLLYLLGTETLEVWRNTGAAAFPLERVDGGFARVGLAATWSPASIMGKLHMLAGGTQGQVMAVRMEGVTPVRISTHAVEESLASQIFSGINGVSFVYQERGHTFWVIGIFGGPSWVYDATESARLGEPQWDKRANWDGAAWTQYKPWYHTFIPEWPVGTHVVGDAASGKLYLLSSDYFDDDGADIRYVRALPYVYSEGKRVFHHRFELEMETGTVLPPMAVSLDWSDDRGQTFKTPRTLGPGVNGVFGTRYYANQLGSSRGRVPRITVQGKGKLALIDATIEAEVGTS